MVKRVQSWLLLSFLLLSQSQSKAIQPPVYQDEVAPENGVIIKNLSDQSVRFKLKGSSGWEGWQILIVKAQGIYIEKDQIQFYTNTGVGIQQPLEYKNIYMFYLNPDTGQTTLVKI